MLHLVQTLYGDASRRGYLVNLHLRVRARLAKQPRGALYGLAYYLYGIGRIESHLYAALRGCVDIAHCIRYSTGSQRRGGSHMVIVDHH